MAKIPDTTLTTTAKTDVDFINALVKIIEKTDLHELEYDKDGLYIRLNRGSTTTAVGTMPTVVTPAVAAPAPVAAPIEAPKEVDLSATIGVVTSPMVGIAYLRPEPDATDFIRVGSPVKEGDTLLIIESMKVFNPIKAPHAGVVKKIFATSGQLVEFATPLVIIE